MKTLANIVQKAGDVDERPPKSAEVGFTQGTCHVSIV